MMTITNWTKSTTILLSFLFAGFITQTLSAQTWGGSTTTANDAWRTGDVGIGTSTPASKLDVDGVTTLRGNVDMIGDQYINAAANATSGYIRFHNNGAGRIIIDGGVDGLKIESDMVFDNHLWVRNNDLEPIFWIRTPDTDGFDSPLHLFKSLRIAQSTEDAIFSPTSLNFRIDSDGNSGSELFSVKEGAAGTEMIRVQQNGRVGISATNPLAQLHLNYAANIPGILIERDQTGTNWENTKVLMGISSNSSQQGLRFELSDDDGANYRDVLFMGDAGLVGIGTTDPAYELDVCGTIRAKMIKVQAGWCDYVFEEDYDLRSLEEVEAFIKANKHLPNIPPASIVENDGLELGKMQTRMMEKIEELTLYTIALNKQVKELEEKLEAANSNK